MSKEALDYAQGNRNSALDELKSILRIPSISTLPEHEADMTAASDWLIDRLDQLGFQGRAIDAGGPPVVYGDWLGAGAGAPVILVYGHYDVQPVDPLELWASGPFEPEVRGNDLYARGASDMKGQIVAHLKAVEALKETTGIPVNIKYLIEGEEEIGSTHLGEFFRANEDLLSCNFCLNVDSGVIGPETPSLTYAIRGMAYFEIRLEGPPGDLHSGTFGGAIVNPANVLAALIGEMHDDHGRVTLPGFYDDVISLSDQERSDLASLPQSDEWWREQSGATFLGGEQGYSATERATARPTLDVNGLLSGFTGEGGKTVLPSKAMAKISTRLVPDQDPNQVHESLRAFMEQNAPPGVSWEVDMLGSAVASIIDRDSVEARAAAEALEAAWGVPARYKREGGTVPVVGMLAEMLDVKTLMLGFGLPDDNLHAPNEKFHLPNFHRGIDTFIHFMTSLAA
jgi:acetylornithine deacetylase/succinyl-diaminopimelate desuccinylase-like protein